MSVRFVRRLLCCDKPRLCCLLLSIAILTFVTVSIVKKLRQQDVYCSVMRNKLPIINPYERLVHFVWRRQADSNSLDFLEEGQLLPKEHRSTCDLLVAELKTTLPLEINSMDIDVKNQNLMDQINLEINQQLHAHLCDDGICVSQGGIHRPGKPRGDFQFASDVAQRFPCTPYERLAVIVPYRNRIENLWNFLNYMHRFLSLQRRDYQIIVVEQLPGKRFNRAKLFNVALLELGISQIGEHNDDRHSKSTRPNYFHCFALHDVDKLPKNSSLLYSCISGGLQMIRSHKLAGHAERYLNHYFGGATLFDRWTLWRMNGASNAFEGWGGEDDDIRLRLLVTNQTVAYVDQSVGEFISLNHRNDLDYNWRNQFLLRCSKVAARIDNEGLQQTEYRLVSKTDTPMFLHLKVDI